MQKSFIYLPLLFFISLFLVDKIFTLDFFKNKFLQTGNVVYYRHREILFEKYKKAIPNETRKIILAMGDSRAYAFSNLAFNADRKSKYVIYNFSAPQAIVAYSLQWLEKILELEKKPNLVFLVLSPEGFDDQKLLMHKPFLRLGADSQFIEKYWDQIPENDKHEFNLDRLIAFRRIEFDFKLLFERWKSGRMREYNPNFNADMFILNLYNGEQLAYTSIVNDEKKLLTDSERMAKIYLSGFQVHHTQFFFLEKFLSLAKYNQVTVFVILPKVYSEYKKYWDKLNLTEIWWKKVVDIANRHSAYTYDFNTISDCELFYDASHQSTICYDKQVNFLITEWEKLSK
jgi:hypothetical protein